MKVDLHLHTTASDGMLAPDELVRMASAHGFSLIAISDHDCMDGISAARRAGEALGVRVLSAVELSCGAHREIHVLGYGVDPEHEALAAFCRLRRENRMQRAKEMCDRLTQAGWPVDFGRVAQMARGVVGRPHVARSLVEAGHATSVKAAFERFLSPGKVGYVPKEEVKVSHAISLIHQAGGAAVLAHPMELRMGEMALEALVHEWKGQGLDGLEVYHPSAPNNHAAYLERLARREGLLVTGGSDFHGAALRDSHIGEGLERWRTVEEDAAALLARIGIA